jgi:hypothetical protein
MTFLFFSVRGVCVIKIIKHPHHDLYILYVIIRYHTVCYLVAAILQISTKENVVNSLTKTALLHGYFIVCFGCIIRLQARAMLLLSR